MIYGNPKAIGLQSSFQIEKMVFISFMGGKPLINGNTKLVRFKAHFPGRENEYRGKEMLPSHIFMFLTVLSEFSYSPGTTRL